MVLWLQEPGGEMNIDPQKWLWRDLFGTSETCIISKPETKQIDFIIVAKMVLDDDGYEN